MKTEQKILPFTVIVLAVHGDVNGERDCWNQNPSALRRNHKRCQCPECH